MDEDLEVVLVYVSYYPHNLKLWSKLGCHALHTYIHTQIYSVKHYKHLQKHYYKSSLHIKKGVSL